ncbi:MAG TPA: hypothetical protein VFU93_11640 [Acidimicrobiales bacterium]|nr:hypothetical protein [Acidimicrobiales bacterium]
MRRSALLPAFLCAALLVAACSSSGDDDGTSAAAGDDGTEAAAAEAEEEPSTGAAVPVTMELEAATAATGTVGPAGGSVFATAADGTEYALQIPPGALGEDTAITVTPLSGLDGLPEDTTLGFGASLEPDGLVFARPSWLFVTSDVPPDEVFSGLRVDDDEASLAGIGYDGERFVLAIGHFSGSGGARCVPPCGGPRGGWPGFPDGGPIPPPGTPGGGPIDQPGGDVPSYDGPGTPPGPFTGDDGGEATSGGNPTGHGSLTEGMDGADTSSGASSGDTDAAVADAVQDLADAQLSGDEEGEARAEEKLDEVKEKVKDEAWDAAEVCVEEKDLTKLKEIVHWVHLAQLLGAAEDDAEEETLTSLISVCYRFELVALADLTAKFGGNTFVIGDSIELTVPLLFDGGRLSGEATGPVDPTGYDRGAELLEVLGQGLGMAMGVDVPNDFTQNDFIQCSTAPGTGRMTVTADNLFGDAGPLVTVMPAIASEASVTCPDPINTFPMPPFVVDLSFYTEAAFPGAGEVGLYFEGWTVRGGATPYATKTVTHRLNEDGGEISFSWDLSLNHVPGPMPPR